jgi:hypothetical protein
MPPDAMMQRFLVILGAVLLLAGLLWPWLARLGLGRLPGDITSRTGTFLFISRSPPASS